jgi:hypothetical protein
MVALNFPDAPTLGQVYEQWTWDGSTWELTPGTGTGSGAGVPLATIIDYYGATAPPDFLECNGSAFDGGLYPALAAHLGGTTLPDLRDRSTISRSATAALGVTKGSADATVPQHQHASTLASPDHTHGSGSLGMSAVGAHGHGQAPGLALLVFGANGGVVAGSTGFWKTGTAWADAPNHTHAMSGSTAGASATALTGAIGNVSGATVAAAGANYHPVMAVMKCIKAVP